MKRHKKPDNFFLADYKVGLNSPSHFSTSFKRHFGEALSEYMAKVREREPNNDEMLFTSLSKTELVIKGKDL